MCIETCDGINPSIMPIICSYLKWRPYHRRKACNVLQPLINGAYNVKNHMYIFGKYRILTKSSIWLIKVMLCLVF